MMFSRRNVMKAGLYGSVINLLPQARAQSEMFDQFDLALRNPELINPKTLQKFAFGSCNKQNLNQSHWKTIASNQPDLWLWLGDNIYANGLSETDRAAEYNKLKGNTHYNAFAQEIAIDGIWDDHDYYDNNSDGSYKEKSKSQKVHLDFLDIPLMSPRRLQEGIFHSIEYGEDQQKIEFLMLDVRYFRGLNKDYPNLGFIQSEWVKHRLAISDAQLIFIVSGINITSEYTSYTFKTEGFNQYKKDRMRFLDMIDSANRNVIILSGDRHVADITDAPLASGRSVLEFMSSGLTHHANYSFPNPHRIGPEVQSNNYGEISLAWRDRALEVLLQIKNPQTNEIHYEFTREYPL